ncbi:MAG TPA: hypothetical protein DDZ74_00715 [Pseudomonas sp.]|nr:hypothetical protein [Pseudomonas sp.]
MGEQMTMGKKIPIGHGTAFTQTVANEFVWRKSLSRRALLRQGLIPSTPYFHVAFLNIEGRIYHCAIIS